MTTILDLRLEFRTIFCDHYLRIGLDRRLHYVRNNQLEKLEAAKAALAYLALLGLT